MHVPVDQTRQDQLARVVQHLGGGRRLALADGGDGLAARGDETLGENGVGADHVAHEHPVE